MAEKPASSGSIKSADLAALEKELAESSGNNKQEQSGKKKKKKGPSVLWTVKLGIFLTARRSEVAEVLRGLRSKDRPTRRMAALFVVSFVALLGVMSVSTARWWQQRSERLRIERETDEESRQLGEFLKKQADNARVRNTLQGIGAFTVELAPVPGKKNAPGVMNLAEIELVVECDVRETCAYVESKATEVRNQVTGVFTVLDREEVLSKDGKRKLKRRLIEKINMWLPKGKIQNVYFSKLVLG
jgi:flagellar basal body-associated protein FliL